MSAGAAVTTSRGGLARCKQLPSTIARTRGGGCARSTARPLPAHTRLPTPYALSRDAASRAYMYCCSSAMVATASASSVISFSSGDTCAAAGRAGVGRRRGAHRVRANTRSAGGAVGGAMGSRGGVLVAAAAGRRRSPPPSQVATAASNESPSMPTPRRATAHARTLPRDILEQVVADVQRKRNRLKRSGVPGRHEVQLALTLPTPHVPAHRLPTYQAWLSALLRRMNPPRPTVAALATAPRHRRPLTFSVLVLNRLPKHSLYMPVLGAMTVKCPCRCRCTL